MTTPDVGIVGRDEYERRFCDLYNEANIGDCRTYEKKANHDWNAFFDNHKVMILDFRVKPKTDRLRDIAILNATQKWHSQILVFTTNYDECMSALEDVGGDPGEPQARRPIDALGNKKYRELLFDKVDVVAKVSRQSPKGLRVENLILVIGLILLVVGLRLWLRTPTDLECLQPLFKAFAGIGGGGGVIGGSVSLLKMIASIRAIPKPKP